MFISNPFQMVVMIVLIVSVASVLRARFSGSRRARAQDMETAAIAPDPEAARLRDEVRFLKERVAVLERVITDGRSASALASEIEDLRGR